MAPRSNADDAFTKFLNNGGWPTTGLSFMVGLIPLVYSFLGFDSVVHMCKSSLISTLAADLNLTKFSQRKKSKTPQELCHVP